MRTEMIIQQAFQALMRLPGHSASGLDHSQYDWPSIDIVDDPNVNFHRLAGYMTQFDLFDYGKRIGELEGGDDALAQCLTILLKKFITERKDSEHLITFFAVRYNKVLLRLRMRGV